MSLKVAQDFANLLERMLNLLLMLSIRFVFALAACLEGVHDSLPDNSLDILLTREAQLRPEVPRCPLPLSEFEGPCDANYRVREWRHAQDVLNGRALVRIDLEQTV